MKLCNISHTVSYSNYLQLNKKFHNDEASLLQSYTIQQRFNWLSKMYKVKNNNNNNVYLYRKTRVINCTILIKNTFRSWLLKITMKLN